jgi:hypothetical protein
MPGSRDNTVSIDEGAQDIEGSGDYACERRRDASSALSAPC